MNLMLPSMRKGVEHDDNVIGSCSCLRISGRAVGPKENLESRDRAVTHSMRRNVENDEIIICF